MAEITVRYVETNYGDTLQAIALRELGNSDRWLDLVWLNDLLPPFITDDPTLAGPRVLLSGAKIALPMAESGISPDELETFGIDVALDKTGALAVADGDWQLESGFQNLKYALGRRIVTEKRIRGFTPEYGCWVSLLRGDKLGSAQLALAAFYVKSALLEDDRVKDVLSCIAVADGDAIKISATVQPIDGKDLSLEVSI
ncbi:hypothetical protein [Propionivibrio sp.]|uniref:hypothetical protein n=1 Tax=Propionivibrio sp. TaxID=2212460 RepID=UPI003BF242CD